MAGYTKLFGSIISSTIWGAEDHVRLVWVTMLALADQYGCVEASVPGLAHHARVGVEQTRAALVVLESPDPDSRTPDHEGRRIARVDGGWQLLNHGKYREKHNEEWQRVRKAKNAKDYRKRHKPSPASSPASPVVTENHHIAEAEADTKAKIRTKATPPAVTLPDWIPSDSWDSFTEMRQKLRAPLTDKAVRLTITSLENLRDQGQDPGAVLDQSVERAWRGVFAIKNGGNNGKHSGLESPAIERQKRNLNALKQAMVDSGDYATGCDDGPHRSLLPEPGVK